MYIVREDKPLFSLLIIFRYIFHLIYLIIITLFIFGNIVGNEIPQNENRYKSIINQNSILFIFIFTWFMSIIWIYLLKYINYEVFIEKKQSKNIEQLCQNKLNINEINDILFYNKNNYKINKNKMNLIQKKKN